MTPTASPHFLFLPREIRDTIYNYTKAEITVLWRWSDSDADIPANAASVTVSGIPTSALLRVSVQVRTEYRQTISSWRVSAICDLDLKADGWMPAQELFESQLNPTSTEALAHVHEATVMVRWFERQIHSRTTPFPNTHIQPLLKALAKDAPHLDVVRLVLYQDKEGQDAHWLMFTPGHLEQYSATRRSRYFTPAPQDMEGFHLARAGEGYKLHYGGLTPTFQGPGMLLFHLQTRVGIFLYRRNDGKEGGLRAGGKVDGTAGDVELVTHEVLVAPRMARPYFKKTLDVALEHERYQITRWQDPREEAAAWLEDAERANKWPRKMQEWIEFNH